MWSAHDSTAAMAAFIVHVAQVYLLDSAPGCCNNTGIIWRQWSEEGRSMLPGVVVQQWWAWSECTCPTLVAPVAAWSCIQLSWHSAPASHYWLQHWAFNWFDNVHNLVHVMNREYHQMDCSKVEWHLCIYVLCSLCTWCKSWKLLSYLDRATH